jgi:regulator of sigma E protease
MPNFLTDIVAVTIVLGIMIFVHEWGHFIVAKLCGVRVDVFSFGFGPRLFGVKRGETDYRLSTLPFGGYVRMAGDNPIEERSGAPYEFLSKPRWQRVLVAVAGPSMNFVLAFLIFWGIFWRVGIPVPAYAHQPADVVAVPEGPADASGVQPADRIVRVNGQKTPTWQGVLGQLDLAKPGSLLPVTVLRSGSEHSLTVKVPAKPSATGFIWYPAWPTIIDTVEPGFPAERAGMKKGDTIISINGRPVVTWLQILEGVRRSDGHPVQFVARRDGKDIAVTVTPTWGMDINGQMVWQVGVSARTDDVNEPQTFLASSLDAGTATASGLRQIGSVLLGLFSGKVSIRAFVGPVGMSRMAGAAAKSGALSLLELMAIISLNLGALNLLPIPILDGGHVLLLAVEGVLRHDLSIEVKERFVQVGLVFLLAVFAFIMYSDILKAIQSHSH